jgi:hypothetical protein
VVSGHDAIAAFVSNTNPARNHHPHHNSTCGNEGGVSSSPASQQLIPANSNNVDDCNDAVSKSTMVAKYRCKRCGQPKQNHDCPHQPFLQRSIGVMVYPAANSYTAAEPGTIARPLTQMNNFVSYDSDQNSHKNNNNNNNNDFHHQQKHHQNIPVTEITPGAFHRCTTTVVPMSHHHHSSATVTPSGLTQPSTSSSANHYHNHHNDSPQSELSYGGVHPPPSDDATDDDDVPLRIILSSSSSSGQKRSHASMDTSTSTTRPSSFPLVASLSLRPEHYRAVTSQRSDTHPTTSSTPNSRCCFTYPNIPLTFSARQRLADTLFCLAQDVHPTMTRDCAAVLRVARACSCQDDGCCGCWDQAVAELLTQVVIGLYGTPGDLRLEGLQRYLLALGISC